MAAGCRCATDCNLADLHIAGPVSISDSIHGTASCLGSCQSGQLLNACAGCGQYGHIAEPAGHRTPRLLVATVCRHWWCALDFARLAPGQHPRGCPPRHYLWCRRVWSPVAQCSKPWVRLSRCCLYR